MHAHATAFASYGVGLDAPAYTKSVVSQALNLYDALGLEAAVEYYSSSESVDDHWYVFIVDEDGYTIAHPNPIFLWRDPSLRDRRSSAGEYSPNCRRKWPYLAPEAIQDLHILADLLLDFFLLGQYGPAGLAYDSWFPSRRSLQLRRLSSIEFRKSTVDASALTKARARP